MSDYGGEAEVNQDCGAGSYGTPFGTYPWYAYSGTLDAFTYGGDCPGTTNDYGRRASSSRPRAAQAQTGPFAQYCSTLLE